MTDNNIDIPDMNNIEPPEGNSNGNIIGIIVGVIVTGVLSVGSYFLGKNKGYKKGFADASAIFEKKYKQLHDAFVNRELEWKQHEEEYRQLISDYESTIDELEAESESKENAGKIKFFEEKLEELRNLEESC